MIHLLILTMLSDPGPEMAGKPPQTVLREAGASPAPDGTAPSSSMRMTSHEIMMPWSDTPHGRSRAAPDRPAKAAPGPAGPPSREGGPKTP